MQVAVLTSSGFEIQEAPVPDIGPDQVLVQAQALGICEGDVYQFRARGELGGRERTLGHEGTGLVVAVGDEVEGLSEGDRVTTLGGPYAEYYAVEATKALGSPSACCVHAAARFGIRPGDRVAVIGCGFMGMMCMQLARMQAAGHICAIEPIHWRRQMAHSLGADEAVDPADRDPEAMRERCGEFDVVIEATGVQPGLDLVGELARQHGRVVLIGYHQTGEGMRRVNMKQWNFKALDVINGHVRREDEKLEAMRGGLSLVQAGLLKVEPLVMRYGLAGVAAAFADLANRKEGLYKAVLIPENA